MENASKLNGILIISLHELWRKVNVVKKGKVFYHLLSLFFSPLIGLFYHCLHINVGMKEVYLLH